MPNPDRVGCATGGPPLSSHRILSQLSSCSSHPSSQRTDARPDLNAPARFDPSDLAVVVDYSVIKPVVVVPIAEWFLSSWVGLVVVAPLVIGTAQTWRKPPTREVNIRLACPKVADTSAMGAPSSMARRVRLAQPVDRSCKVRPHALPPYGSSLPVNEHRMATLPRLVLGGALGRPRPGHT